MTPLFVKGPRWAFLYQCQTCSLVQSGPPDGKCVQCNSFTVYPKSRLPGSKDWKDWLERIRGGKRPVAPIELTPSQVVSLDERRNRLR